MPEVNIPPCPTHGAPPRALHTHNFEGIIFAASEIIETVSGVGTISYSRCPYGYPNNFEGVVRVLEDLNTSISGIQGGGGGSASGIVGGSGITIVISGNTFIINSDALPNVPGSGIYFTSSGTYQIINSASLPVYPGSGITPESSGTGVTAGTVFNVITSGQGSVVTSYDGTVNVISGSPAGGGGGGGTEVIVSGDPGENYGAGTLWFDTNQGRLFVYASGNDIQDPDWYQTNSEAVALISDVPPSGQGGFNAPPRDGSIWFNSLLGSLFVYDEVTSGWYETGPQRSVAFGPAAPAPSAAGAGWYDTAESSLKIWTGVSWVEA